MPKWRRLVTVDTIADQKQLLLNDAEVWSTREQEASIDEVVEKDFKTDLFSRLIREIAQFPPKQRRALLIDLACHSSLKSSEPTTWKQVFTKAGLQLQDYQSLHDLAPV